MEDEHGRSSGGSNRHADRPRWFGVSERPKLAKTNNLILIYDEAHTLFSTPELCSALRKSDSNFRPRALLFSSSGEASSKTQAVVATPSEITQKFIWTPPLPCTSELKNQLDECGIKLDEKRIQFFIQFCGGHRSIFIAAMHWVKSKQTRGESWDFQQTVGFVRNSFGMAEWDSPNTEILGYLRKSRAVRVNGRYDSASDTLCQQTPKLRRPTSDASIALPAFLEGCELSRNCI